MWRGRTADECRAARRGQSMEAAHLVTSGGIGTLGVRATCREADLTEHYFYGNSENCQRPHQLHR